jgi:DNA-binding PadR family transcriptional regulator
MGRWDRDDERSSEPPAPEQTRAERQERAESIRELPEQLTRDRDPDLRARGHHLTLPSGPDRESARDDARVYHLRGSEVDLLERAACFRSVFTDDLRRASGDDAQAHVDLRSLERQELIEERTVTRLRDGAVADVITVTDEGKALLDHHRDPHQDVGQEYYAGRVKPAEIWHDASLLRMCWEMENELGRDGAHIVRIVLDDELKARAYAALHDARDSEGNDHDAHTIVAGVQGLHVDDDRFVFPDVRLEVDDRDGTIRTVDLERITEHYHRGHISGKAGAGFQMFRGASSSSRRGTPHDPHTIGKLLR